MQWLSCIIRLFLFIVIILQSSFAYSDNLSTRNTLITPLNLTDDVGEYTISPGDILEITVFEVDELNENVRVSSSGFITLPLLGLVKVAGLTPSALEKHLESLLIEKYLQSPQVKVYVKESGWFFVGGAIKEPGPFSYRVGITLTQAIAQAGGLEDNADPTAVQIISKNEDPIVVNIADKLDGRIRDIVIKRDDTIYVKLAKNFFVNGAVIKPGAFSYKAGTTLTQAIAHAGGLNDVADPTRIRIIRIESRENEKKKEIIEVDLKETEENPAKDTKIRQGDTIFVPKNSLKAFLRGLGGLVSVGFGRSF